MVVNGAGIVVALQANYLEVELNTVPKGYPKRLLCTRRSRLSHRGMDVHVGDRVHVEAIDPKQARAVVVDVSPRKSWLTHPSVANASLVVVVLAVDQPTFDPDQASRFLLAAERTGLDIQLVLTKVDLISEDALTRLCGRLRAWGYETLLVSSKTGFGIEILKQRLQRSTLAVLYGPSGVGKSSLLNNLLPYLSLRVGTISKRLQRGQHTTRHVELFPLGKQTLVADTPGFHSSNAIDGLIEVASLFPELRCQLDPWPCRFRNCSHQKEPGCGVDRDWERYNFYITEFNQVKKLTSYK
ncbi:ribosome small subunit-dependent GTPase A [Synechococcus sp. M16CYN]|uniref:ribosome small subunit-dependent GTPase A n=1 Tax=Synechococcus sp. M16CYN TaxID=3103139 RepID=UPI003249F575